jgi:hypothetical protein
MVGPPRLHEELGANGVEVTIWERVQRRFSQEGSDLKTWPATTRSFRSGLEVKPEPLVVSGRRCFPKGSSRGRPAIQREIFDFQLPIAN